MIFQLTMSKSMQTTGPDMKRLRIKVFSFAEGSQVQRFLKQLSRQYSVEPSGKSVERRTYYDTFDWRLHRKNMVFVARGGRLHLQRFNGREVAAATGRKRSKYFWWDVDAKELGDQLRDRIEMRALCPIIELSTGCNRFRIMNRDRKTIARLVLRCDQAVGNENKSDLPELITIQEIRGYENEYQTIVQNCYDLNFGEVKKNKLIHHLLKNSVRIPRDYGVKFKVELDEEISIGRAVARICLHLIGDMEKNHTGVVNDIDSEFLHDFRIAVRRTRSLLSLLKNMLPAKACAYFQEEFRRLGSVTGPVRDIDVYLLERNSYLNLLPSSLRDGMDTFFLQLENKRVDELKTLQSHLNSERYKTLIGDWRQYLTEPDSDLFASVRNARCRALADKMIVKRFKTFIRDGNLITPSSGDEELHELRIKGKKFRYLLEFFKSFYDEEQMSLFLKQMKKLQDNLGTFNDLSVQQDMLGAELKSLRAKNLQTIRFAAALGGLIAVLGDKHKLIRDEFEATYSVFAKPEVHTILHSMVKG